mgnify:CR=1 FL=1
MRNLSIAVLCFWGLAGCGEDAVAPDTPKLNPPIHANKFLTFVNTQASLAAGVYDIKVVNNTVSTAFSYQLDITLDNETQNLSGEIEPNVEQSHEIVLSKAGGLAVNLTASNGTTLGLYRNGQLMAPLATVGDSGNTELNLPNSKISNLQYSEAYYAAVDPDNKRTTLSDWKQTNGFDQGDETYIVFRDTKDLGYGRSMFVRKRDDGSLSVFVDNYIVGLGGKSPENYGPLNVHAAVDQNRQHHVGSNAIEFSPVDENDPSSPKIMKFFTFTPADENGVQHRRIEADLDGRGIKPVPTTCISCHGGALLPLDRDGKFQLQALQTAKFNQLEVNTFEYSDLPGFTQADQENNFKTVNQYIFEAFDEQQQQAFVKGHWSATFAKELADGRYGGGFTSSDFKEDFVPEGWKQNGERPDGVETLYKSVIEPHCISCHSLRGTLIGEATKVTEDGQLISLANAVNFSSYEKFISFSERIKDYVFVRGQMPLSLRNYEEFWQNPAGKPTLLASFLPGFDILDENNQVQQPSRPIAKVAHASSVHPPEFILGQASVFADSYQWRLVSQPADSQIQLGATDVANLMIESADEGEYQFELVVTNDMGVISEPEMVTVNVSTADKQILTFVDDIRPLMGTSDNTSCSECHRDDSEYPEIPAYYADTNPDQYYDVLARIDFADPKNSPILIKPTSKQHGGSIRFELDTESGLEQYNKMLDWILSGAPCGDDSEVCH